MMIMAVKINVIIDFAAIDILSLFIPISYAVAKYRFQFIEYWHQIECTY